MPGKELRLLALDGGGVRGLSSLMILERLMETINPNSPPKPCEYFDMIGGTSTGGLIAVMLGRLEMTIDECLDAYLSLSDQIFQKKAHRVTIKGKVQARFDSSKLEQAVKEVLRKRGLPEDTLLKSGGDVTCKVFVCATTQETSNTRCLTSYMSPRGSRDLLNSAKIWEACRATSAASTFFDPIAIGRYEEKFMDGGTGANNPVWELWNQAQTVYGAEPLEDNLDCLVSIGTGVPHVKAFPDDVLHIHKSFIAMATETERTAERFQRDKAHLDKDGRYYRFNVVRGLEEIGLEESKKKTEIAVATLDYVESQEVFKKMKACADRVSRQQCLVSKKHHIPFSLRSVPAIDKFADRPDDLVELGAVLLPRRGTRQRRVFVLSGLGGIGKTQLAAHFARQNHDHYSAVFWLDGSSEDNLKQSIAYAARRVPQGQIPEASRVFSTSEGVNLDNLVDDFLDWLSREDNDSWLVVFDNVDREYRKKDAQDGAYDITRYFSGADHGSVLITTRLGELDQHGTACKKLQGVDNGLAKAILCQWYRRNFDEDHGDQLLELLAGLPLALTQAAAYMQQTQTSFGQYINLYNTRFRDLMQSQENNGVQLAKYHSSIWTTWMISFERIRARDEAAAELLLLWAHLDNQDLWYGLFEGFRKRPWTSSSSPITMAPLEQAYSDEIRFNNVMGLLLNYCLVESKVDLSGYVVHPVVHQWAQHIQSEEQQRSLAGYAVKIIGYAVPSDSEQNYWVAQRRLLRHAERCYQWVVKDRIKLPGLEEYNSNNGSEIDQNLHDILSSLSGLGNLYRNQEKLNQAENMYQHALQGYKKALGKAHILTLDTINNLGSVYQNQGKLDQAEEMYHHASGGYLMTLGHKHPSTISTSNKIGNVQQLQGKLDLAEFHYCQALHWYTKTLGPLHPSTLPTAINLASLYRLQGKPDEAERFYKLVLQGYDEAFGVGHIPALSVVCTLANLYSEQGKLKLAEKMYRWVLQEYEKALGQELMSSYVPALDTYKDLGKLLDTLNKPEDAVDYYQRALIGLQEVLGPSHQRCRSLEDIIKSMSQERGTTSSVSSATANANALKGSNVSGKVKVGGKKAFTKTT